MVRTTHSKGVLIVWMVGCVSGCQSGGDDNRIRQAMDAFEVEDGMRIELVASEPLVVDPVAFAFDEDQRMYVVEDRGYPDPAEGGSPTSLGQIALLEDADGDGVYDRRHDFVTDLTYPNGILPWKGGVFVTCSPHIYYFKDTNGDGVADVREVVLTGFHDTKTSQIRMSHPTLGLDGWIYVTGGLNGGDVISPDHPDRTPVSYTAADGRFHPETLEFQVTGGKSQFGLSIDPYGRRFGTSNRHPVMQAVIEPSSLQRNPHLIFNETIQNVSKVEAEAVVYPISTAVTTADYSPKLIGRSHAGTFTAASGLVVFHGTGLTSKHRGNIFICESAQNLVQRQVVNEDGASFYSEIAKEGEEFLSSTDEWFRPVYAQHGPTGGLYIADMHRKVIDHPSYVPEEMRDKLDFESGKTDGRIYRVVRKDFDTTLLDTIGDVKTGSSFQQWVNALSSPEEWKQSTAYRLLLENKPDGAIASLKSTVLNGAVPEGRARALWLLHQIGGLDEEILSYAFKDSVSGVREQAVQIFDVVRGNYPTLMELLYASADDMSPRVRFLTALALGNDPSDKAIGPLVRIAIRDGSDKWARAAVLSGVSSRTVPFLSALITVESTEPLAFSAVMQDVGRLLGNEGDFNKSREFMNYLLANPNPSDWRIAAMLGLVEGMASKGDAWTNKSKGGLYAIGGNTHANALDNFVLKLNQWVLDENESTHKRSNALALLGFTSYQLSQQVLRDILDAKYSAEIQLKAVEAIARLRDPRGAELLTETEKWSAYSPKVKSAVIASLVSDDEFTKVLFKAIEKGDISPAEVSSVDRLRLMKSKNHIISAKANELFKELEGGDRMAVYQSYRSILEIEANAKAGAAVFQSHCAVCHTYAGKGGYVGPDLTGVKNQPPDALLLHTIVPNYEVYPAYQSVLIRTKNGDTFSGWVVSETEHGLTIRTAFGTDESILRANIESLANSGLSLMPDGLEQTMTKEDLANLIAYLKTGDE